MSDIPTHPQDPSLGGQAVDQSARNREVLIDEPEVQTEDDVVESLRRQLQALEGDREEQKKAREEADRRASEADRARQDADHRARQAEHQARTVTHESRRSTAEAQLDSVKNALVSHESQMTSLEAAWAGAQAEGDFAAAGKAQREMAILGGRIAQLEAGRDALEQRAKEAPAEPTPQETGSPSQQREAYIQRYTPKVQEWLRGPNGDRFFNDTDFQKKVMGAASYAENVKGLNARSQEYIDFIETEVGIRQTESADAGNKPQTGQGRAVDDRRVPAAPAGGSTGGSVRSNADGSTSVYLTATEKELAKLQDMTEAEYAREKVKLTKEGLIGPNARGR